MNRYTPARRPEDALDRLEALTPPRGQERKQLVATVREALERLRSRIYILENMRSENYIEALESAEAEARQLREERDAAKRELREFEHVDGEPLYETAAVAASSFAFARHRAEAAEAENRRLTEGLRPFAKQPCGKLSPSWDGPEFVPCGECKTCIARALLSASPSGGGGAVAHRLDNAQAAASEAAAAWCWEATPKTEEALRNAVAEWRTAVGLWKLAMRQDGGGA